jgi:hypothetical protein
VEFAHQSGSAREIVLRQRIRNFALEALETLALQDLINGASGESFQFERFSLSHFPLRLTSPQKIGRVSLPDR